MLTYLINKVQGAKAKKKDSKGAAYWATFVAACLGAVVVVYVIYRLFSRDTKLAKVLHERDVLLEERKAQKVRLKLEEGDRAKADRRAKMLEIDNRISEIKVEEVQLEEEISSTKELINRIKDGDDVEKMVKYTR